MKDFAEKFYKGGIWQKVRAQFVADRICEDGGMCQRCHDAPGFIVHHKIELNATNITDAEIALNPELLEFVCLECHNREHGYFTTTARCDFDENGDVIPPGARCKEPLFAAKAAPLTDRGPQVGRTHRSREALPGKRPGKAEVNNK